MGASPTFLPLLAILASLAVVLGIYLLKRGRWPKRIGTTPHCRHCDYILSGLEADRCPECGALIRPGTPIFGERHRRPGLAFSGVALMLLGLAFFGVMATGILSAVDWNRYKPLSWLLKDMDSTNSIDATAAWNEVQRRITAHLLSDSQQNQLIERALKAQLSATSHNYDQTLFQVLTKRYVDHQLSPAQEDRFFAAALNDTIEVRPVVGSKDPVPYWIWSRGRGPDGWWTRTRILEWQVDNGKIEKGDNGSRGGSSFGGGGSGSSLPPQPPGKHHLRVRVELATRAAAYNNSSDDGLFDKTVTRDLETDFVSVEGHAPIATTTAPAASVLQPLFTANLSVSGSGNSAYLNLNVDAKNLPVDSAFDCFILVNGKEYPCGGVNFHNNRDGSFGTGGNKVPKPCPAKVDVILRSSETVARGTTDLTTIWKGEIVLKDVVVKLPTGSATQPATQK
jgi:hypothetical protein